MAVWLKVTQILQPDPTDRNCLCLVKLCKKGKLNDLSNTRDISFSNCTRLKFNFCLCYIIHM